MRIFTFIFILTIIPGSVSLFSQPGKLDSDFNADGIVITDFGAESYIMATAIQDDNKIVAAGYASNGTKRDFALVRYNPDGSVDHSFGDNGKKITPIGNENDEAQCIAIQKDGKILVGGFFKGPIYKDMAIVRYNSNGLPDSTFGKEGIDTSSFGMNNNFVSAIALQSDGKILLSGYYQNGTYYDFALARFNTDGSPDTTFGIKGKVITHVGLTNDYCNTMALQPNGKILLGGSSFDGVNYDFSMVRYTSAGMIDTTFSFDGKVLTSVESSGDEGHSMHILPDGKILFAGIYRKSLSSDDIAVMRYNTDGTLDHSFGTDGKSITDLDSIVYNNLRSMTVEQDGKIILAGYSTAVMSNNSNIQLLRMNSDGTIDSTFGTNGYVITDIRSNSNDYASSVLMQPDGRIVVGGYVNGGPFAYANFVVLRYLSGLDISGVNESKVSEHSFGIFPNPVTNDLNVRYSLPRTEQVSLSLYNLQGELVRQMIIDQYRPAGENHELIYIRSLAPGIYLLSLKTGSEVRTIKLIRR